VSSAFNTLTFVSDTLTRAKQWEEVFHGVKLTVLDVPGKGRRAGFSLAG